MVLGDGIAHFHRLTRSNDCSEYYVELRTSFGQQNKYPVGTTQFLIFSFKILSTRESLLTRNTVLRWYDTLKYGDFHEKFNFLKNTRFKALKHLSKTI